MKNFRSFSYSNIKKNTLFRSETLFNLSKEDQKLLIDNGVKLIVDLRGPKEREAKTDTVIPGIDNISLPLNVIGNAEPIIYRGLQLPDLIECYRQLVSVNLKETWTQIFSLLLNKEGVLFHCSQGKDRTGVVAAMILSSLKVDRETIINDYLKTNEKPVPVYDPDEEVPSEIKDILNDYFSAKREYLEASFDYIDKTYGSIEGFLFTCCGLNQDSLNQLRIKYLLD